MASCNFTYTFELQINTDKLMFFSNEGSMVWIISLQYNNYFLNQHVCVKPDLASLPLETAWNKPSNQNKKKIQKKRANFT